MTEIDLLDQPRMYYESAEREQNVCRGLVPLIEKATTKDSIIAEVGSFAGVSSEVFARSVKQIYCVDLWTTYTEIEDPTILIEGEKRFDAFMKRYKNVTKIKKDSVAAAADFEDGFFDFVYLDAFHELDTVKKEIRAWVPKIKPGGYIGGHDSIMWQVRTAVEEELGKSYETFKDTSWLFKL
jgi:predicted O-methyltransferase YrrM